MVRARAHLVHEIGVEVQAEILPLLLPDMDGALRPIRFAQRQVAVCIIPVKAVVQNIYDLMSVDGQQLLAGLDSRELRRAARSTDAITVLIASILKSKKWHTSTL